MCGLFIPLFFISLFSYFFYPRYLFMLLYLLPREVTDPAFSTCRPAACSISPPQTSFFPHQGSCHDMPRCNCLSSTSSSSSPRPPSSPPQAHAPMSFGGVAGDLWQFHGCWRFHVIVCPALPPQVFPTGGPLSPFFAVL
jgi:hypothetical protein